MRTQRSRHNRERFGAFEDFSVGSNQNIVGNSGESVDVVGSAPCVIYHRPGHAMPGYSCASVFGSVAHSDADNFQSLGGILLSESLEARESLDAIGPP